MMPMKIMAMTMMFFFFRRGRDPIVVLGFVLSMLAYFLTFLAIPNTANLNETNEPAFIEPNRCGFKIGILISRTLTIYLSVVHLPL